MSSKYRTDKRVDVLFHDSVLDEDLKLIDILPTEIYPSRFWLCERSTDEGFEYVIRDDSDIDNCFYYGD